MLPASFRPRRRALPWACRRRRRGFVSNSRSRRNSIQLQSMKTEVYFHSTIFNCTEPKDYFINECCFGDDVARWLIKQLKAQGLQTADEPCQEDFGWYFTFH